MNTPGPIFHSSPPLMITVNGGDENIVISSHGDFHRFNVPDAVGGKIVFTAIVLYIIALTDWKYQCSNNIFTYARIVSESYLQLGVGVLLSREEHPWYDFLDFPIELLPPKTVWLNGLIVYGQRERLSPWHFRGRKMYHFAPLPRHENGTNLWIF